MYTFHRNTLFYIYLKALKQTGQNIYIIKPETSYSEAGGKWAVKCFWNPYMKSSPPPCSIKEILWSRFFHQFLSKQHTGITPQNHAYGNLTLHKKIRLPLTPILTMKGWHKYFHC